MALEPWVLQTKTSRILMTSTRTHFYIKLPKLWQPWRCQDLVRLGKRNDGGYLVSRSDIASTKKLVSFGIGCDWIFEQQFTEIAACPLAAFDEKIPPQCHSELTEWFKSSNRQFTETRITASSSGSGTSVQQCCDGSDIFLKCDIEGGEYEIFTDILNLGDIWSGMVLEVHNIHEWSYYDAVVNFLSKVPLKLVHLHVNNWGYFFSDTSHVPSVLEITLSRHGATHYDPSLTLPHPLDMPNNADDGEFFITF